MDGLRHPVGRQPARVYWMRRLLLLAVVVLVAVVVWFLIFAPSGDGTDSGADDAATSSVSADATSSAAADVSRACGVDDVEIAVAPAQTSYATGSLPEFEVTITHVGSSACLLATGDEDSELLVTSGSDRIYSTADCPAESTITARDLLLSGGATESLALTWTGQRSAEGSCDPVDASPRAGTYNATVTLQGITAEPAIFQLTD